MGQFRAMSAKEVDAILSKDELIILVSRRPRFTIAKYAPVPVRLYNQAEVIDGKGRDDLNSESIGEDTPRNTGLENDLDA